MLHPLSRAALCCQEPPDETGVTTDAPAQEVNVTCLKTTTEFVPPPRGQKEGEEPVKGELHFHLVLPEFSPKRLFLGLNKVQFLLSMMEREVT